jgi:hypothetical protein
MTIERHPSKRLIKALQLADTLDAAGLGSADVTAMDTPCGGCPYQKAESANSRAGVDVYPEPRECPRRTTFAKKLCSITLRIRRKNT